MNIVIKLFSVCLFTGLNKKYKLGQSKLELINFVDSYFFIKVLFCQKKITVTFISVEKNCMKLNYIARYKI